VTIHPLTDSFPAVPAPQADRLSIVATVVDAVSAGCTTADAIAEALGMSGRQGGYYPNAAWFLGYVEPVAYTSPVQWQLTDRGAAFVAMTPSERAADLCDVLSVLPELDAFTADEDGAEELAAEWSAAGYSEETVSRRVQTISAWTEFLTADTDAQVTTLEAAQLATVGRAPAAVIEQTRRARVKDRNTAKATGQLCDRCFVTKPLTNVCPTCG
jgi:hypothetical protein